MGFVADAPGDSIGLASRAGTRQMGCIWAPAGSWQAAPIGEEPGADLEASQGEPAVGLHADPRRAPEARLWDLSQHDQEPAPQI